jgi:hypothetical protein
MGWNTPSMARRENVIGVPGLSSLQKIAPALNAKIEGRLEPDQ